MSNVPTIQEEDEDVTTTSASLTSEISRSLTTAVEAVGQPEHDDENCRTASNQQDDTTITGASSDLPIDDPSSGSTENADDCILDPHDFMTSSYTEISFASDPDEDDLLTETEDQLGEKEAFKSSVVRELTSTIVYWTEQARAEYDNPVSTGNLLSEERPPTREWTEPSEEAKEIVSFVADDLEHQLKLSSPARHARLTSSPNLESRSSTIISGGTDIDRDDPSSPGHSPADISCASAAATPAIDVHLLNQIESQVIQMNSSVNAMMSVITNSTHSLSKLTVECTGAYENCLSKTCDSVDTNIKSMYQLMAQVEELNRSMKSIEELNLQLNSVKHLLDIFERKIV